MPQLRRYLKSTLVVPTLLLAFAACDATGTTDSASTDPLVDELVRRGLDPRTIRDQGGFFLVEGDIVVPKSDLRAPAAEKLSPRAGPRRQYHGYNLVSGGVPRRAINVFITGTLKTNHPTWTQAVREAMGHWNSVPGFNLRFHETSTSSGAHIVVSNPSFADRQVVAGSQFPRSTGAPGPTIYINTNSTFSTNYSQRVYTMVHEMGHTIGLRHSNWHLWGEQRDTLGAIRVAHTDTTDLSSVMNRGAGVPSWSGFSQGDRVAARVLYPGYMTASGGIAPDGRPLLTWDAVPEASYYAVVQRIGSFPFETSMVVGTTTGTSYTAEYGTVRGWHRCDSFEPNGFFVQAVFPEGTATLEHYPDNVCFDYN